MKRESVAALILTLAAAATVGCGKETHASTHAKPAATPAPAPPTPDTTPIEALRTPAGLVLKPESPAQTPTPAP